MQHGHMRCGLRHGGYQGHRRGPAADHHDALAAIVEVCRPALRVDQPSLEVLAAGKSRRVSLLIVVVAAAQIQEAARVADRLLVFADFRLDGPA